MDLPAYAKRLAAAVASKKKSAFDELCFDLEYEQLTLQQWPSDIFAFFVEALRDPAICSLSGARSFVLSLYNDFEKLTEEQRALLLKTFDAEADNFSDEMLRHSVADLVARKYSARVALDLFRQWSSSSTPSRLHMALVGLEVLIMANKLDERQRANAQSLLGGLKA